MLRSLSHDHVAEQNVSHSRLRFFFPVPKLCFCCVTLTIEFWTCLPLKLHWQTGSLMTRDNNWIFKAAFGALWHNEWFLLALMEAEGCPVRRTFWALMVSDSVSYWKSKMDQFSQLELCLTAKAEFVCLCFYRHCCYLIFLPQYHRWQVLLVLRVLNRTLLLEWKHC